MVSYATAGRDLLAGPAGKGSAAAAFGDPDYDAAAGAVAGPAADPDAVRGVRLAAGAAFDRLRGTADEVAAAAGPLRRLGGAEPRLYLRADATEAAFKALDSPRVLLISTHGYYEPGDANPLARCGLALAGANGRGRAGRGEDGILTGLEVVGTRLAETELVVLSACETGLGEVRDGDGVSGLRQAFHLAGARQVVASLWPVPDAETTRLMAKFLDRRAAGRPAAERSPTPRGG